MDAGVWLCVLDYVIDDSAYWALVSTYGRQCDFDSHKVDAITARPQFSLTRHPGLNWSYLDHLKDELI